MVRFTRIVCPVDLSDYSQRALDHAMAIAQWHHAHVWALQVHQLVTPALAAAPALAAEAFQVIRLSELERIQLETSLRDWVTSGTEAGSSVEAIVQEDFNVSDSIVSYAEEVGADLITIATHGRSGFKRFVLGSVTEKILRIAPCAVLVVPPHAHEAAPRSPVNYQRIVCPVDCSAASLHAVDVAASLAADAGGRLTIVHIVEAPPELADVPSPVVSGYRDLAFSQARQSLSAMTTRLQASCSVEGVLRTGKPAREILRLVDEEQADLIVMGVEGSGAVDRLLFGSVCQRVVREATCPVLTVGAHAKVR
jgi:nucleotide-binding universal stress UspA family protein